MISANRLNRIQRIERLDPFACSGPIFKRSTQADDCSEDDGSDDDYGPGTIEFFEDCTRGILEAMRQQRALIKAFDQMGQEQLDALAEHLGIDRSRSR
jgi:hypothetical protein